MRQATGVSQVDLNPPPKDVKSLLNDLVKRFGPKLADQLFEPGTSRLRDTVVILVNGHSIKLLEGLDTRISDRDLVTSDVTEIFQAVGGG
jgi:molybdopterin converting factor small subunit